MQTTHELDDLREELAELRHEMRRAMKLVRRRAEDASSGVTAGVAGHIARAASDFVADLLPEDAGFLRRPVERAIAEHPLAAAAAAIAAAVMLQRYIGFGRVARAAMMAGSLRR